MHQGGDHPNHRKNCADCCVELNDRGESAFSTLFIGVCNFVFHSLSDPVGSMCVESIRRRLAQDANRFDPAVVLVISSLPRGHTAVIEDPTVASSASQREQVPRG
jgi:hypothetical protein